MPGWLGNSSPDEPLPCHQTIDYGDPQWLEKWMAQQGAGKMCAGALVFMANKVQRPHDREFPTMPKDPANVFSNSVEFVRHHREAAVRSWDDEDQNEGAKLHRELIGRAAKHLGSPIVDFRERKKKPKVKP